MSSSRKRKQHPSAGERAHNSAQSTANAPDPSLYIQAHEADIIRGPQTRAAAQSLEVKGLSRDLGGVITGEASAGDGLIRWGGLRTPALKKQELIDDTTSFDGLDAEENLHQTAIWVDRYDARLLLDTLPPTKQVKQLGVPRSPSGWSDLPSDSEDMFFFSPDEAEDYRREKRRRVISQDRENRLKALQDTGQDDGPDEEIWGGSDEEPDDPQKELMCKTAAHVLSSPNPAQLEMRILANHGSDKRFAFLRGRWARTWRLEKGRIKVQNLAEKEKEAEKSGGGLGGLADYGDSDQDDDDDEPHKSAEGSTNPTGEVTAYSRTIDATTQDTAKIADIQEARRAKAKEWAEKRRLAATRKI